MSYSPGAAGTYFAKIFAIDGSGNTANTTTLTFTVSVYVAPGGGGGGGGPPVVPRVNESLVCPTDYVLIVNETSAVCQKRTALTPILDVYLGSLFIPMFLNNTISPIMLIIVGIGIMAVLYTRKRNNNIRRYFR
jgi:hypothetical protein